MFTNSFDSNSRFSAISRRSLSVPAAYLEQKGMLYGQILDYGCGRGGDMERLRAMGYMVVGYDPYYQPAMPRRRFDVVLLTYVLNVVAPDVVGQCLFDAAAHLKITGDMFITVRRDVSFGATLVQRSDAVMYYQYYVAMKAASLVWCPSFQIYHLSGADIVRLSVDELKSLVYYVGL